MELFRDYFAAFASSDRLIIEGAQCIRHTSNSFKFQHFPWLEICEKLRVEYVHIYIAFFRVLKASAVCHTARASRDSISHRTQNFDFSVELKEHKVVDQLTETD